MKKINLKALFIVLFPLVFFLVIHFTLNYLPRTNYVGYPIVGLLGAGAIIWWRLSKPLLFAKDIKIVPINHGDKNEI